MAGGAGREGWASAGVAGRRDVGSGAYSDQAPASRSFAAGGLHDDARRLACLRRQPARPETLASRPDLRRQRRRACRRLGVGSFRQSSLCGWHRPQHGARRLQGDAAYGGWARVRPHRVFSGSCPRSADRRDALDLRSRHRRRPKAPRVRLLNPRPRLSPRRRRRARAPRHQRRLAHRPRAGYRQAYRRLWRGGSRRSHEGPAPPPGPRRQHVELCPGALRRHRDPRQPDLRHVALPGVLEHQRPLGRRARLRRQDRRAGMGVQDRPAARRVRQRHLGRRVLALDGQYQCLDHDELRSRTRHRLPARQRPVEPLLRRHAARRQPLRHFRGRGGRRHRRAQVALPDRSSRHLGLRPASRACGGGHRRGWQASEGGGAGEQGGLSLRLRPRDRRAAVAHRGARRAAERPRRRAGLADAALPHLAAAVRDAGAHG